MGLSLTPELGMVVTASGGTQAGLTIRNRCEILRMQLQAEAATFRAHWQELNDYILPRRGRFYVTDVNKGDKRNGKIIDSTATAAARTLAAGMMAGVTSPARPWFRLQTGNADLDSQSDVQDWLHEVQTRMSAIFLRSNLYNKLPILYGDMGVFGTAAMALLEDDESVIRCYDFPVGTYVVGNDHKMRARVFLRLFRLTVQQIVERWGLIHPTTGQPNFADGRPTTISFTVQNLWRSGNRNAWIDVVHVIQPNYAYDGQKIDAKYKRFEQIYYEIAAPNQPVDPAMYGLLEHTGFDEFPVLCARWEVNSEDVYATNCPGMTALGDIKQLQTAEKRLAQAIEKMINPPMIGPAALRTAKTSLLPGDVTYLDVREGMQGFRPVHEVNFGMAIAPLDNKNQQIRLRIQRAFYEDLFLMLAQSDRREITAREVDERHEEKLLALGPMLEQLNQDVLDPIIDRTFAIMARKGLLPTAPDALRGMPLHVTYVSIMAQAQKQIGLAAIERYAGFVSQVAQVDQSILDNLDVDELARQYGEANGVPPKIIRDMAAVAQIRQQKQQAAAQQQAAANIPGLAGAAKDMAATPASGDNILSKLIGKKNAYRTIGATASPPPGVV